MISETGTREATREFPWIASVARIDDRVAHASRVLVLASRRNNLSKEFATRHGFRASRKVRDDEDAIANTQDACATQKVEPHPRRTSFLTI